MARTPVWSEKLDSGAVRFGFSDGTTQIAPGGDWSNQLNEALPDRLAGATAEVPVDQMPLGDMAAAALSPQPAAPANASDANPLGAMAASALGNNAPAAPRFLPPAIANKVNNVVGAVRGTTGRTYTEADRWKLAAEAANRENPVAAPLAPSAGAPTQYAANPNEGRAAPPAAPRMTVVRTPGAWNPTSRQYQYKEVPAEAEAGMTAALDARDQAAQIREGATREETDRQLEQQQATDAALQYEEEQQVKRDAERQARAQAELDNLRQQIDDVGKMRINSNAYWEEKSVPQRIGLAIALGITNAAGMPGLQNMINGEIKANIDAQKANKGIADKTLTDKVNVYQEMLARFGDEKSAELAATAVYQKQIARQAEMNAARLANSDPMRAARSLELKAAYDSAAAEIEADLHGRQVIAGEAYTPPQTRVYGGGGGAAATKPDRRGAKEYGKARAQFGIDTLDPLLAEVEATTRRYKPGETVPGWSAVDMALYEKGGLPALRARHALSGRGDEAVKNFQLKIATTNNILRTESGAAIGEQETVNKSSEWFGDGDTTAVRNGIARAQRVKGERVKGMQQTYGPAAVETYHNNLPGVDNTPTYEGPIQRPGGE